MARLKAYMLAERVEERRLDSRFVRNTKARDI